MNKEIARQILIGALGICIVLAVGFLVASPVCYVDKPCPFKEINWVCTISLFFNLIIIFHIIISAIGFNPSWHKEEYK